MSMTEPTWVIIRSRSRCEDVVERGFLAAGYRAYVPRFRVLTWPHGVHRKPAATMRLHLLRVVLAIMLLAFPASGAELTVGSVQVVDGDTLRIGSGRVRLWGIDAPEHNQPGGAAAIEHLRGLLAAGPLTCEYRDTDRYGRTVMKCGNAGGDIGGRMVSAGWAIDYARYSRGTYAKEQAEAHREKRGIWANGDAIMPEKWRSRGADH